MDKDGSKMKQKKARKICFSIITTDLLNRRPFTADLLLHRPPQRAAAAAAAVCRLHLHLVVMPGLR